MRFKRVVWIQYLFLFMTLYSSGVEAWLIYSLSSSKKAETLLVVMTALVGLVLLIFIIITISEFARKKDVIILENGYVLIRIYKEKKILFKDIKDVRYMNYGSGGNAKKSLVIGKYQSGTINFYLTNNQVIHAKNVKDVKTVCFELREKILKDNGNA